MNRLQIVQRLRQEAGVAGNGPNSLASLNGDLKRLSDWADAALIEIQGMARWDWRWSQPQLTLPANASRITGQGRPASSYVKDSLRLLPSGTPVEYLAWAEFRQRFPGTPVAGALRFWTVAPDGSLRFDAMTTADQLMTVEAYATPAALGADTEEPSIPPHLRLGVVWLALQKYAAHEEAGSLYQTAEREWQKVKRQMERDYTPEIELGGALC